MSRKSRHKQRRKDRYKERKETDLKDMEMRRIRLEEINKEAEKQQEIIKQQEAGGI